MESSSSSPRRNEEHNAFSGIEPPGKRRKVDESSRLFDVFINHRGPDVKQNLALQLYNSLTELGIHAFLDSEEKELGNSFPSTIENAIHSASAHIAIFSKRYAESPWCLAELLLMLQSSAKIIPVFYGVYPSSLRYIESGEYAQAFRKYEEKGRYMTKLKEWKEALHSISFLAGHEINSNFSANECQIIVSAVQKEVQRKETLHVAKYPVGLDRVVKDFERSCLDHLVKDFGRQCPTNEGGKMKVQIVGIFGMGGVGKTTLVKELFNRKRSQYTKACFMFDVREAYANKGFPSLQMKLLKDLYQKDNINFHCIEEGTSHIGRCVERSQQLSFLIVVDDIDHLEQLDALLIRDMLNKSANSLVIVTTRDAGVLINAGITVGYNLKGMDKHEAKELFCWHAFSQSYPSRGYEKLVDLFVEECGGLALSLQVLGRHVHGEDQKFWELELDKVKKTLPRDIHKRLRISIDTLDSEERQIFMDVACFFIGELTKHAIRVWKASGWSAQHALRRLKDKCLVEEIKIMEEFNNILDDNTEEIFVLRMHDHLRDLGREMADELNHPRRLWRTQHSKPLISKGIESIFTQTKGRCLHTCMYQSDLFHVKYFLGESDNIVEGSTALLWLEVNFQEHIVTNLPPWIPLQNLQTLKITGGGLKSLLPKDVQFQAPFQLKELRIYKQRRLKELKLGFLRCLEEITIYDCMNLKSVTGISDLNKLVELNICRCWKLEELNFAQLSCLGRIEIAYCKHLKSVIGITDLPKLESFNISCCEKIEELSLVRLSCLEFCSIFSLPILKRIEVKGCKNLTTVDGIFRKLVKLKICDCPKLEKIPDTKLLHSMERMQLLYCSNEPIRNCILNIEKLPTEFIKVIGRAVEGAESTVNANLFCDFINVNSVIEIGTGNTCDHLGRYMVSAIIFCAVVVVNTCTAADLINEFISEYDINPWLKFEVRQGNWIITSVITKEDEIKNYIVNKGYCFPFDYLCFPEDVTVKRVTMPVMKGEEHKILNALRIIIDKLYQK